MKVPYEGATSGTAARDEIHKILHRFGCSEVGFKDNFELSELMVVFTYRGRNIQMTASAKGWAAMYLKENPWNTRRRKTREDYERDALYQGLIALNSILRDWVKGQVTAVESGVLKFEHVFLPYMLTGNGQTVGERVGELKGFLPALPEHGE